MLKNTLKKIERQDFKLIASRLSAYFNALVYNAVHSACLLNAVFALLNAVCLYNAFFAIAFFECFFIFLGY